MANRQPRGTSRRYPEREPVLKHHGVDPLPRKVPKGFEAFAGRASGAHILGFLFTPGTGFRTVGSATRLIMSKTPFAEPLFAPRTEGTIRVFPTRTQVNSEG